jgi:alkylhydroperoxidase/carboxymuconolactone decarboxylase family protein YurZ
MRKPSDKEAHAPLQQLDPTFCQMALKMGGVSWDIQELSQREKSLLCLISDICAGNFGLAFEMHVNMALANEVPTTAIKEAIYHSAPDAGYAMALQAIVRFKEIGEKINKPEVDDNQTASDQDSGQVLSKLPSHLDARFENAWKNGVGQQWTRPQLRPQERAILSIAAMVANQTFGEPFEYFVRTALQHGVTEDRLRAVICFLSEFSFPKSWLALNALRPTLESLDGG